MSYPTEYLQVWDYAIIVAGLVFSSFYGLYHGMRSRKATSTGAATFEYLLASRKMDLLPITFSYFASLSSTGTFLGHPSEIYSFGLQISLLCVTSIPCAFVINEIFLPIYYQLKSGSLYEYLELRFNIGIRNLVTTMAAVQTIIMSSVHIYGPATSLSQVTGVSSWFIVLMLSILCIVYTTLGGMRAVIVADVVQSIAMFASMFILLVIGVNYVGSVDLIYERNLATDRLNIFELDFDLNFRHTFWNTTFAYFFLHLALGSTSQFLVQRLMTAPNLSVAKWANVLGTLLFSLCLFLSSCLGIVMYATFHGCDPLQIGLVQNMNQMVPAYLMKILSSYVTLPGIIFTGILCASLSTLSSIYNSTATILFNMFPPMSDKRATILCKTLVFIVGVLSILGVVLVEMFPNVLQSVLSLYAAVSAPLVGMLLIGIFCPQANIKATCVSFMFVVCFLLYVIAGTLLVKPSLVTKSFSMESCSTWHPSINATGNATTGQEFNNVTFSYSTGTNLTESSWAKYFPFSSMSYLWYAPIGTLSTIFLFAVLSSFVGKEHTAKPVNLEIIPEVVQRMHRKLPQSVRGLLLCDVYEHEVQAALQIEAITSERL